MTTPTLDELRHLRAARGQGHMYRTAKGTVVINPAPNSRAGSATAVISPRRNAMQAVVELLLLRGWLHENRHGQFSLTDAGRDALESEEK